MVINVLDNSTRDTKRIHQWRVHIAFLTKILWSVIPNNYTINILLYHDKVGGMDNSDLKLICE